MQVEVRNQQELEEALEYGAEAILLDNMTPKEVKRAVERIQKMPPVIKRKAPATRAKSLDSH